MMRTIGQRQPCRCLRRTIEFLFLDLDDTILDFHKAEAIALSKTLHSLGLEPTEQVLMLRSVSCMIWSAVPVAWIWPLLWSGIALCGLRWI